MLAYYEFQVFYAKLVLSRVKQPESEFRHSFLESPALNAQATAEHETRHPSLYFSYSFRHDLSKAAEDAVLYLRDWLVWGEGVWLTCFFQE